MSLLQHKKNWEDLGELDPYWAVASHPNKKFGKWDKKEFFATGKKKVDQIMEISESFQLPQERDIVVDFGCGLGRMYLGFSRYFKHYIGVDISKAMLEKARDLHNNVANAEFINNTTDNLSFLKNDSVDLLYCDQVLQHNPDLNVRVNYIHEFIRVIKPKGLIIFNIPTHISWYHKIQFKRRLYNWLRFIGVSSKFLYQHLGLYPISMSETSDEKIRSIIAEDNAVIKKVIDIQHSNGSLISSVYYIAK